MVDDGLLAASEPRPQSVGRAENSLIRNESPNLTIASAPAGARCSQSVESSSKELLIQRALGVDSALSSA